MKISGQIDSELENPEFIKHLDEIVISGSAKELRKIGKFFKRIANEIEDGNMSDHYHFRKNIDKPDIIITPDFGEEQ